MEKQWQSLCHKYDIPSHVEKHWLDVIKTKYSERHRHYHTLEHIIRMLTLSELVKNDLRDVAAVTFSIFFHDIIYNPTSTKNEEQSAELFVKFTLDSFGDTKMLKCSDKVVSLIIATSDHTAVEEHDEDLNFFLDMDLEVLGRDEIEYDLYASQIRQEYSHVDDESYRQGRRGVLKKFADAQQIFRTETFRNLFEEKARNNIQREYDRLKE